MRDEFGAMPLARFEIAKQKLRPNRCKKAAERRRWGVIVVRGLHARLVACARRLAGEAKHEERHFLVTKHNEARIVSEAVAQLFLSHGIATSLGPL